MTNRFLAITLAMLLILGSCTEVENNKNSSHENIEEETSLNQEENEKKIMKSRNFRFVQEKDCKDALMDTLHERGTPYVDSLQILDEKIYVAFKFKDACCQRFSGHYTIENHVLIFEYYQVNNEVCSCICWYQFKLEVGKTKERVTDVVLRKRD